MTDIKKNGKLYYRKKKGELKMKILKEHVNTQGTGGLTIIEKRKNSRFIYVQYWGVYGNEEAKRLREEAKELGWF